MAELGGVAQSMCEPCDLGFHEECVYDGVCSCAAAGHR